MASDTDMVDLRDSLFDELYEVVKNDPNAIILSDDQGALSLNKLIENFPTQYINCGIAEQNIINVAGGLALTGKKVFVYGITPFVTYRCLEQLKIALCSMNLPVAIIGSGAGLSYGNDGPTHHAMQDISVLRALPEMTILCPSDGPSTAYAVREAQSADGPVFIRCDKGAYPQIHVDENTNFSSGMMQLGAGQDLVIFSTGIMVHLAQQVAQLLTKESYQVSVYDILRLKPIDEKSVLDAVQTAKHVATLEEHSVVGGLGSIIAEILADHALAIPFKRLGLPDKQIYEYGSRDMMQKKYGLESNQILSLLKDWMEGSTKHVP